MIKFIYSAMLGTLIMLISNTLSAQQREPAAVKYQSIDSLHQQALEYLKQKVDQKLIDPKIHLKKLNPRIQLPHCQSEIELSDRTPSRIGGRNTLGIKCHQPAWQTFISAYIDGKLSVVIASQGILKQAVIKAEDIVLADLHYKKVPQDALRSLDKALGMRAKKNIAPHKVLTLRNLQPPYWVLKKQPVNILTKIGNIEVSTKGIALQNGVEHQQVDIKNISSNRTIKGIVIAPNTVMVP